MRIELDAPLTKTKLRQALKMAGSEGKTIKVIMGTEIFDIDTIVSKNNTIYLRTDSKQTSDFYENKVEVENDEVERHMALKPYYVILNNDIYEKKLKETLDNFKEDYFADSEQGG